MYPASPGEFVLLLVLLVQVVLEGLVVLVHQGVQGVLHHQEVLHLIRGSSTRVSSSSRGSPISMRISSSRGPSSPGGLLSGYPPWSGGLPPWFGYLPLSGGLQSLCGLLEPSSSLSPPGYSLLLGAEALLTYVPP